MERFRPSTIGWLAVVGGVAVYDCLCPQGETLSEGVDRALETPVGKILALGAIAMVAGHLSNLIPEQYDIIHQITAWKNTVEEAL